MANVLSDIDGLSLIYMSEFIVNSGPQEIMTLIHRDSLRRTAESVSLVELSLFRSLIERNALASLVPARPTAAASTKDITQTFFKHKDLPCCNLI